MIYKKTKNFNTLHGLIKNLGGQYNTLMVSFQNLYDSFSVVSGFTELLKHEIETQKEKQKILQKELKEAYGEISAMKIKEHGNNDSDKLLFNDLEKQMKNHSFIDSKQMTLFDMEYYDEKSEVLVELMEFHNYASERPAHK